MGQALQRANQVGTGAEFQRCFARANLQVATHARGEVDDDVHVGLADALHHFAVQGDIAAETPGLRIADMAMNDGCPGLRRLHGSFGDLFWCDRYQMALAGGVAGTGQCTGDDDVMVHVRFPSGVVARFVVTAGDEGIRFAGFSWQSVAGFRRRACHRMWSPPQASASGLRGDP
ncbi:hypothetical protein D3C78_802080 [compost metagenome]